VPWTEKLPSGKYRARYYLPDKSKRTLKEHFDYKSAALRAASAAELDAASLGWRDPKAAAETWGAWSKEWWINRSVQPGTLARDKSSLRSLEAKWGQTPLIDIKRHDIRSWAVELAKTMAPATVERRVYLFSASLSAAVDAEILTVNPAARLKLPRGETDVRRYLTEHQADTLLAQFTYGEKLFANEALVTTLLGTGMRWGEAVGLQIGRVDLRRGVLRVVEVWDKEIRQLKAYPKGRKIRDVPIPDWVVPFIRHSIGDRTSGFVFGNPPHYSNWYRRVWLVATERGELAGTRPHDLRHTYASRLLQRGIPLAEVGKLLGHTSAQTTQIYAHLAAEPSGAVLAALSRTATPVPPQPTSGVGTTSA
jgi:integrase